jgi:hypothetical protein
MYNSKRTLEEDEIGVLVHQGTVLKAILVEKESEESFDERMKAGINSSQIYVGIFGNRYSDPTCKEYEYARKLGLPLLVYYFTMPARTARNVDTNVVRFLEKDVRKRVVIRGNYRRIEARTSTELIDLILSDLACTAVDIIREAVATRRMLLEEAPNGVISAILTARKTVFE